MALRKSIAYPADAVSAASDWRDGLPTLRDASVTLRQLRAADAPSLVAHLDDARVWRYMSRCPSTAVSFARFIRWTHAQRRRAKLACFGIVPAGAVAAVGVIQIWPIERDFSTVECGFALGASFWGSGLFESAVQLVFDAVFSQLGVYRLEARVVDINTRGNRTFEKLGARRDGVLRGGFRDDTVMRDHVMWSILAPEWQTRRCRAKLRKSS
jgi:ribosomal-protein-alanine N-acetyltransferase